MANKTRSHRKPNWGGMTITPDENLAKVVGTKDPLTPPQLQKRLWGYLKRKGLVRK